MDKVELKYAQAGRRQTESSDGAFSAIALCSMYLSATQTLFISIPVTCDKQLCCIRFLRSSIIYCCAKTAGSCRSIGYLRSSARFFMNCYQVSLFRPWPNIYLIALGTTLKKPYRAIRVWSAYGMSTTRQLRLRIRQGSTAARRISVPLS